MFFWIPDTQNHTRAKIQSCPAPHSTATSLALGSALTVGLHSIFALGLPWWASTEPAVNESLRLYPTYFSLATSSPSCAQFDFWTQVQDPPFIPIKFHLVRFRLLFQPVEIILDLDPVSYLPLCFMSSANVISMLSMFPSKSSMERLGGQRQRHGPLGHWRLQSRLLVINHSAFIEYCLPSRFQFTEIYYHTAHISPLSPVQYQGVLCQMSCWYPDALC